MIKNQEEYYFGNKLKEYRIKNNLTQEQVAQMIGTDAKYISQIEIGKNKCNIKMLFHFCNIYGVTPNDILCDYIDKLNKKNKIDDFTNKFSKLSKEDREIVITLIEALNNRKK